jgi:hypothetical protein
MVIKFWVTQDFNKEKKMSVDTNSQEYKAPPMIQHATVGMAVVSLSTIPDSYREGWQRQLVRPPESTLTLNGLHTETATITPYRTFIILYYLFESEQLSTHFKLTLHKALIRYVTTYARPTWEFTADTHLMKLQ